MELALFMFVDDNPECGIQLYRAEKSYSIWNADGKRAPAEHKLYGGEKLSMYKHLHVYNELDAISRREKDLGYMDPSHVISEELSDEDFELWFDHMCGIVNTTRFDKRFSNLSEFVPEVED